MSAAPHVLERWAAPQESGELLWWPAPAECLSLAAENRDRLVRSPAMIVGQPLSAFRQLAQAEALQVASRFSGRWGNERDRLANPLLSGDREPLMFVTGHQPLLAHPGVWVKNLVTSELARRAGGRGIHLIVDHDIADFAGVMVPAGTAEQPHLEPEWLDRPISPRPWEECVDLDRHQVRTFGERVSDRMRVWGISPFLSRYWPLAWERSNVSWGAGDYFTCLRLLWEETLGVTNQEIPLSALCETTSFLRFLLHLASHADHFRRVHNACVGEYRTAHKLKNSRHPFPDLQSRSIDHSGAAAIELPFWVWRHSETVRQRMYCQVTETGLRLLADSREIMRLPAMGVAGGVDEALEALSDLKSTWKIRPRAIATTLYARLALADLFVHGIGGAKYDMVTNRVLESFWGMTATGYAVVSATLRLPLPAHRVTKAQGEHLRQAVRRLEYDPIALLAVEQRGDYERRRQVLLDELASIRSLQRSQFRTIESRRRRRELYQQLQSIKEALARGQAAEIERLREERDLAQRRWNANQILSSREFAAVLFPEDQLQALAARCLSESSRDAACGRTTPA